MDLNLEKIVIIKNGMKGEASVKYNLFSINKIMIDLNSPVDSVSVPKWEKSAIISGSLIEEVKVQILDLFQDALENAGNGMYQFESVMELKATKL